MAVTYGFFNDVNGDRLYTAEQIGKYLQGLVSSGVYADASDSLQVMAGGGLVVTVRPGRAMLHYHWMENDEPLGLSLAAGGALPRVDAVVMRLDMGNRLCEIAVKQGAASSAPVAPTMTRTDAVKEYMLAQVRVPALASAITQANITDTRANNAVCGWVHGLIDQLDTSTLFLQWQAAYEEEYAKQGNYLAAQQAAWETFFASVTQDNVLPAPAISDAGKFARINAAGNGYVLANPVAKNLLDNSDFTNPVNQRGLAEYVSDLYTNPGCIDRWKIGTTTKVSVLPGAIAISGSESTASGDFLQRLPAGTLTAGKKYTMAIKTADGTICAGVLTAPNTGATTYWDLPAGNGRFYLTFDDEKGFYDAEITVYKGNTINVVWAALYEGEYTADTLPVYLPKGYAAELLECQRYYWRTNFGSNTYGFAGHVQSGTEARISVPCPVMMRANPTVTGDLSNISIIPSLGSPTAIAGTQADAACVHLRLTGTYSTTGIVCFARFNKTFEFSAEL